MLGSFFGLYWVFFQVLGIIHINILSPIHVRNFWSNLGFLKKQKWVLILLSDWVFSSEYFVAYSANIWNFIYWFSQKSSENSNSIYAKFTFKVSQVIFLSCPHRIFLSCHTCNWTMIFLSWNGVACDQIIFVKMLPKVSKYKTINIFWI